MTPLWSRAAGNCHPNRDTQAAIASGGFRIASIRRFGFAPGALTPRTAHILGAATIDDGTR
ncbi:hypothetical protein [Naasia aerilata]|uniref:hypothetical protein n=1 Tax=Naasia aerilata TaxID=1162966 RepID=UPI00257387E7|nr:hypothetical protein [Naasia aerilata]